MIIRKAEVNDCNEIAEVHLNAWKEAYRNIMPKDFISLMDLKSYGANWKKALSRESLGRYLVAESESRIIGFATFGPAKDVDLDQSGCAELVALNISPCSWRSGVGSNLLQRVLQETLISYSHTYLWVAALNIRAVRFYEAHGFIKEGRTKSLPAHGNIEEVRYVYSHS